jgi:hypothetical protein
MARSLVGLGVVAAIACSGCSGSGTEPGGESSPPGPVSAETSSFTAPSGGIEANGTDLAILAVVARDADGRVVHGRTVSFSASGAGALLSATSAVTDRSGLAWVSLASTIAGVKTARATVHGVQLPDRTITFVAGPPSDAASTLAAAPSSVAADGVSAAVVTARVMDAFGNPVPGAQLSFGATGASVSPATASTDADGVATAAATSAYGGTATVRVHADDVELAAADVTFVADPSLQIAAARAAADGPVIRPVQDARVTYVKAALGGDPAGFFVQAAAAGPALFVAIDPASLAPAPVPGDDVSFTVLQMATVQGMRRATAISGWTRHSTAEPLAGFVQDVSVEPSLVVSVATYESELVRLDATVVSTVAPTSASLSEAALSTDGLPAEPALRLGVAKGLLASMDLVEGCSVRIGPVPLWRRDALALPSAWTAGDLQLLACPAPRVVSAIALDATSVRVTVDRHIDPGSLTTVTAQLAFSGGLFATDASVNGRDVVVTTSSHAPGAPYTVTVAASVKDTLGAGVDAGARSAPFTGYRPVAIVELNEVGPAQTDDRDLVELRVATTGWAGGIRLEHGVLSPTVLATLPDMELQAGDLVVVHLNAPAGVTTETTSKTSCADGACFGAAWDVVGATTGIPWDGRVLTVRNAQGTLTFAVPFGDWGMTPAPGWLEDFGKIQELGLWHPASCYAPCTLSQARSNSAPWSSVGSGPVASNSAQRSLDMPGNDPRHWTQGSEKWGEANWYGGPPP